ncbi:hypothetical protein AAMO2058_001429600 [Amorphochlora amoebiformis]
MVAMVAQLGPWVLLSASMAGAGALHGPSQATKGIQATLSRPFPLRSQHLPARITQKGYPIRRVRRIPGFARDPQIPDAIVKAEANSNKQRPLRFAGYALFGAYGLAVMLSNSDLLPLEELPTLTFFDRPARDRVLLWVVEIKADGSFLGKLCNFRMTTSQPLNLAIGALALGLASYFTSSEIDLREQNIDRIWAEVQKRREIGSLGENKDFSTPKQISGKKRKKKDKRKKKGFGSSAPAISKDTSSSSRSEAIFGKPEPEIEEKEGLLGGIASSLQDTVQQANIAAKYQALELNAALEDRGILPKLNQTQDATTKSTSESASVDN